MEVLEGIVIAAIIIAGVWVGYHAWQESLHEEGESHEIEMSIQNSGLALPQEHYFNIDHTDIDLIELY